MVPALLFCSLLAEAAHKEALLIVQDAWGVKIVPGWSMDVPLSGWKGIGWRGVSGLDLSSAELAGELVDVDLSGSVSWVDLGAWAKASSLACRYDPPTEVHMRMQNTS